MERRSLRALGSRIEDLDVGSWAWVSRYSLGRRVQSP